jgi:hypothetical protein
LEETVAEVVSAEVHLVVDLAEAVSAVDLVAVVSLVVDLAEIGKVYEIIKSCSCSFFCF